jgi:predicted transcriptional regulator of viral defense system
MDISNRIIELALKNGGSVTSAEIQALGASREWTARRVREGWLERIGPSTYRLPGTESPWKATLAAACHRLGGVVSHESAAQLHEMPRLRRGLLVVSVPVRRSNRYPGVDVRQKTDLSPEQVTYVQGLPVTTPARTLIDMAAHLGTRRLSKLVDSAVAQGLTTYEALLALLEHLARRGKPGIRTLRMVMADRGGGRDHDVSELEDRLLTIIVDASMPLPTREFEAAWLTPTNGRVDLAYKERRLVVECDSRRWHMLADAFLSDRERDNRAQLAGWRVLRFTWWDIEERPEYVVSMIREALSL